MEDIKKKDMEVTEATFSETSEEDNMIITFKKPYVFEGTEYKILDLNCLDELSASDMIAVDKRMKRNSQGIEVMPEVTLEYACELAARGCKLPIEFFMGLPPKEAMKVKNRVMGFLFSAE